MTVKLLHVTTVPETLRFLAGHVKYAKHKGFEVHALSSPGASLDQFGRAAQIEVHAASMPRRITPLGDLTALGQIVKIMRRIRPTIVDGHTPKGGLLAMMAASLCRVPVRVYHMLGLPMVTATGLKRRILRWSERTACKLSHQALVISSSLRDLAIAEGLCPAEKIKVLRHGNIEGVEALTTFNPRLVPQAAAEAIRQRYEIPGDALVIGFVGRIVRDKGLIELVQAWRALREDFPALHLLVAGPFESQDPIPPETEAVLRNDPRVHLAGMVSDMPPIYRALDLLILPTYREGFGTVLLEAAAMELPVIATRVPGCMDAVRDNESGTLVPARNADAIAVAARTYLGDADRRRRHGRCGREWVLRDFNPEDMCEALFQEYLRLLGIRGVDKVAADAFHVTAGAARL